MKKLLTIFLFISINSFATNYYIDPTGSNANTGAIGSPWLTLTYACAHATISGDIINVNTGTFVESANCNLSLGVSIVGVGVTSHITFTHTATDMTDACIRLVSATEGTNGNQSISNLYLDGNSNLAYYGIYIKRRSNVSVHDCTIINFKYGAINFNGKSDGVGVNYNTGTGLTTYSTGNQLYNCTITNCSNLQYSIAGVIQWTFIQTYGCGNITLTGQTEFLLYGNTLTQTGAAAGFNANIIEAKEGFNKGLKIYKNHFFKAETNGGDWNFCIEHWDTYGGIEIDSNDFHGSLGAVDMGGHFCVKGAYAFSVSSWGNTYSMSTSPANDGGRSFAMNFESLVEDADFHDNTVTNFGGGVNFYIGNFSTYHQTNIKVYRNIFKNMGYSDNHWAAVFYFSSVVDALTDGIYIQNNTCTANTGSFAPFAAMLFHAQGVITNLYFQNNIVIGFNATPFLDAPMAGNPMGNFYSTNNILRNNGNSNAILLQGGETITNYVNTNNLINNTTNDPLFVSPTNFYLQPTSPAINAGINVGLPYSGSAPDIGANEFIGTRYFVAANGNDANNGTSTATPFKTIAKVNTLALVADDIVSFNGGDIFSGSLIMAHSGTAGHPIIYNSYGTGNAIISGFVTVSLWNNLGANIWESTNAVSTLSTCNMVVINGINTAMGRFPNTGYLPYQTFTATSITSSSLNSTVTNWTGAQAVIRKNNYIIDRCNVTSASGGALTISNPSGYNGAPNYGFFIENDVRTLDAQNEWYYNPATKKIRIYSTSSPTNVQVSTIDTLVNNNSRNNIVFSNLKFTGSNTATFAINFSHAPKIINCYIDYSGINAIMTRGGSCDSTLITGTTINHTNNNAIDLGGGSSINSTASFDTIRNTAVFPGMAQSSNSMAIAIQSGAAGNIIQNCVIDSTGYNAIYFMQSNVLIHNNLITNSCLQKIDGAGIYTDGIQRTHPFSGQKIYNNIVLNGIGSNVGTTQSGNPIVHGIYCDDGCSGIEIYGNTVAGNSYSGIFLHNDSAMNVHNNTIYNNTTYGILLGSYLYPASNFSIKNNIFFSQISAEKTASYESGIGTITGFGTLDSNYYARPIDDTLTIQSVINALTSGIYTQRTLAQWVTYSAYDVHSKKSPRSISNVNQLDFEYNATTSTVAKSLPAGNWIDVTGTPYNTGTVTLQPYTSVVLISTGTNIPPIANAGTNVNITLPTNSFTQVGSGTDTDGSIVAYSWTQVSGANTATINSPNSATTLISNLIAGNYVFQLQVTDNGGATGIDTMSVVVNSVVVNQPPIVNAGGNKIITLPVSTVTQTGSATPGTGTIVSYSWTQSGSNPTPATIVSPTNPVTVINGFTLAGVYSFTLFCTDNLGSVGSQTITVTVNALVPVPPTAHAGVDQVTAWPTNSVTLSGSATAGTGTIVSYAWAKISGPVPYGITNAGNPTASVTGLDIGVYQFQLTVTDNSGLQGTDVMQVTVNKGSGSLSYTVTSKVFNNAPQSPDILTSPAGLATATTYNGVGAMPTNAAAYNTISNITDLAHWNSTPISGVFTITPKAGTFTASNTSYQYDSTLKTVSVSTSDPAITFTISNVPQRYKNTYPVTVHNTNTNFNVPDANVTLTITAGIAPPLVWNPLTPITYPTAISASNNNAGDIKSGAYNYNPANGFIPSAGSLQLQVDFTPSDTNLAPIIGTTRTITVNKGTDVIVVSNTTQTYDGLAKPITATSTHGGVLTILYGGSPTIPIAAGDHPFTVQYSDPNYQAVTVSGTLHILQAAASILITNFANLPYTGSPISVTVTSAYSYSLTFNGSATIPTTVGSRQVIATITDPNHFGADTVTQTIIKATPSTSWPAISGGVYPFIVSSGNLNASSTVSGNWIYNVNAGDILTVGTHVITGTFTPTDGADYNSVVITNSITVTKGNDIITVSDTIQTFDGIVKNISVSTLHGGQITINYTGAHTAVGNYPFTVTYLDSNRQATPVSGTLHILANVSIITITNFSNLVYTGSPINVTVTCAYSYSLVYNPSNHTNVNNNIQVIATINDGIHTGADTVIMSIIKANPPTTWGSISAIPYPTPLSGTQLNLSSSVLGSAFYTPASGTVLGVGTTVLNCQYTPTDLVDYNIINVTNTIVVNQGVTSITVSDTIQAYDGLPKSITAIAGQSGTLTILYGGNPTPPTAIGDHPFTASFNSANWTAPTVSGTLHITTVNGSISITNFSNLSYTGSPITPTVNSAYSYTLSFSPATHIAPGSYTVIATINDGIHIGADTVTMTIIKATPTGTWGAISPQTYIYTVQVGILNATASVAGSGTYNVNVGDTLVPGTYNLLFNFEPTDNTDFNSITLSNSITVNIGSATINVSGTSRQYNGQVQNIIATTTPPNLDSLVIAYTGGHLNAGSYPFNVQLHSNLYTASTVSGTLIISQGAYLLAWPPIQQITQGTPLSAVQLNPTSGIAGTFTFNYPIGTVLTTGTTILVGTFYPTDSVNYPIQTISASISVAGSPFLNFTILPRIYRNL